MNCYFCDQQHPGGVRLGVLTAIGICKNCGAGICREHAQKQTMPGAPLLCLDCAKHLHISQKSSVEHLRPTSA